MESDIFSVSVCGAHVVGNRGAGKETVCFSFGEHCAAWPGASGFFVLIFFNSTDNYHKAFFTITTIFSSPIINMHCLCSPFKILEKNSDLKTQETFEAVIRVLKICKDGAIERIFR